MTNNEFKFEMDRLKERFGEKAYTDSFLKLLWKEVSIYPKNALEYMADRAIGELRQAPLLPEFRKWISDYRERSAASDKQEFKQGAQEILKTCSLREYVESIVKDPRRIEDFKDLIKVHGHEGIDRILKGEPLTGGFFLG